tara:strand:- start:2630 stop:4840 length:2211 start_codon:yes stop_codon:yes gene_type:complete
MPYQDLTPPAGLNKVGSQYTAKGQWYDANLIRFFNGVPQKLGGWTSWVSLPTTSSSPSTNPSSTNNIRSIFLYRASNNTRYTGVGTRSNYSIIEGTLPSDITPVTALVLGNNPVACVSGNAFITFTCTDPHGLKSGDLVRISGLTGTIGGIDLTTYNSVASNTYDTREILSTPNTTTFTLLSSTANATASGGGNSVVISAYLAVGSNSFVQGTGWGSSEWGGTINNVAWGSVGSLDYTNQLRLWSEDNFGDDLLINPRGGPIYYWDKSLGTGQRARLISTQSQTTPPISSLDIASTTLNGALSRTATAINVVSTNGFYEQNGYVIVGDEVIYYASSTATQLTGCVRGKNNTIAKAHASGVSTIQYESNAPFFSLQVMTSDQDGHCISFGCNPYLQDTINPMHIRWSATENAMDWTPRATNSAGGVDLSSGSEIVGALSARQEILIWTDTSLYSMRFAGGDFVFNFSEVQDGITMISPRACANAGANTYFMGERGFYKYSGAVDPIPCPVEDYIFDDLDISEQQKVFAVANPRYNEVWWFYPSNEMNTLYTGSGTANSDLVSSANSSDPTRCVIYNYVENTWTLNNMWRSAGATAYEEDYMLLGQQFNSINSFLVRQDDGDSSNSLSADPVGNNFTSHLESGDIAIGDGEDFVAVSSIINDIELTGNISDITNDIYIRNYPSESPLLSSSNILSSSTTKTDLRARGRAAILKYEHNDQDSSFRLFGIRMNVYPDGRR